jgi:microcystin-dependent protein
LYGVLDKVYPVGSIYISTVSTNPDALMFGDNGDTTWVAFGAGRVLVGIDSSDTNFDTAEETDGVKEVTLTKEQSGLPAHTHYLQYYSLSDGGDNGGAATGDDLRDNTGNSQQLGTIAISGQDASQAHTNLQPYIVTYMWKRTA